MTVRIGQLRLRLPAGYAGRAGSIAQGIAAALARVPVGESRAIDALSVGPIQVNAAASDGDIASAVVQRLAEQLEGAS